MDWAHSKRERERENKLHENIYYCLFFFIIILYIECNRYFFLWFKEMKTHTIDTKLKTICYVCGNNVHTNFFFFAQQIDRDPCIFALLPCRIDSISCFRLFSYFFALYTTRLKLMRNVYSAID